MGLFGYHDLVFHVPSFAGAKWWITSNLKNID